MERDTLRPLEGDPRFDIVVCGIGPSNAAKVVTELAERQCTLVLSWGLAGSLTNTLSAGTLTRPATVIDAHSQQKYPTSDAGADGVLVSVDKFADSSAKVILASETGAQAVDMESAAIAKRCLELGIAFRVYRAISDELDDRWIDSLAGLLDTRGKLRLWPTVRAMLTNPTELLRARKHTRLALQTLLAEAEELRRS